MSSCRLMILIFLFSPAFLFAQRYSISGYVSDAASGESLVGANVVIEELNRGSSTNEYGFYSITLEEGVYTIKVSFLGYEPFIETVELSENKRIHISLNPSDLLTEEVVVRGERSDRNIEGTDMGRVDFSIDKIRTLPVLLGEVDIMKTLQLLPGVQSAGEGNSGFYVRGGGADQNLVLLDEAVVYNPGHLFGFFSVFNGDAIRNATMIKGGIPAQYGGRLSSVIDISMKEGNNKEYKFSGGIGLLASRVLVEGPILSEKASFMISARRTYIDLFLDPLLENIRDGEFKGNSYFFYDFNAKINYRVSERSRFFLSGYFGRDVFNFRSPEQSLAIDIPWGNSTATFRWNYLINDRLFMNATAVYNDYNFSFSSKFQDEFQFNLASGIRDYNLKLDFDYFPNINHRVKTGLNYTYHSFDPYNATAISDDQEFEIDEVDTKYAHELAVYLQDDFSITDRLKVNIGLRGTVFQHTGPYKRYFLDNLDRPIDSVTYKPLEPVHTYWGIEPRFSMRYTIDGRSSLKAGIMNTKQYIHMVSSATTTLPTDLWVPSTKIVKPQNGWQYSVGYFRNFLNDQLETSVEVFYRTMDNQIEFKNSYTPNLYTDIEDSFVFGEGNAYGIEFFIQQNFGNFFGWIGYSLSYANRTFEDLNEGEPFPAKFDRRHDLSVTGSYQINDRWSVGILFVYGTGQAITVPTGRYFIEGNIVNQYEERNGYRMPAYHRMDLSATYSFPKKRRFESELVFSVYNVYSRRNPFFIFNNIEGNIFQGNVNVSAQQVSLFPILPSVSYNFNF
ncbi:MAG: TonB-dependent receptor [Chitinophagaceae bacterium]|nr:MAG: TonB-dependent receptor [Chitinophagaceae bacterium]